MGAHNNLRQLVIAIGDGEVQGGEAVVLLTLVEERDEDHLDDVLDCVWEVPDQSSSNLGVDQAEEKGVKIKTRNLFPKMRMWRRVSPREPRCCIFQTARWS